MSTGMDTISFAGLRAAGHKDTKTGLTGGGLYYPSTSKNGKIIPARWEGNFFLNRRGYTDQTSHEKIEGKSELVRIVVWNSKNTKPGKGMADIFSKIISVGKELDVQCEINTFNKRIFINGQPVINPETNLPLEYQATTFRVTGAIGFGADAENTIIKEISTYTGNPTFDSRPAYWNVLGHADKVAWDTIICPARMEVVYNGVAPTYGYARVIVPEGATVVTAEMLATSNAGIPTGITPTAAAEVLTNSSFPL
jgi:hypothetical protein